ncbi:hypothetical protein [Actinoplanes sp. NPDC051494]|uniref:hypothetical protein n=1 Tax=Actinoplanes sp. NPDC051494 TaxID=3363907 RepID=UPI0037B54FDC
MTPAEALDLVERLLTAAQHPDVSRVYRYDGATSGVALTYRSDAKAFFSPMPGKVGVQPADLPEDLGRWTFRGNYALKMLVDLLEAVRPAAVTGWRTVAIDKIAMKPAGIELSGPGGTVVLRVTSGGPMGLDSDPADFENWRLPEGITV